MNKRLGNIAFFIGLPALFLIYIMFLTFGYSIGLQDSLEGFGPISLTVISLIIAFALWFLAVLIAFIRSEVGTFSARFYFSTILTIFLLFFSALGMINATFFYFEGRAVLNDTLRNAQDSTSQLISFANKNLPSGEFEQFEKSLTAKIDSLVSEFKNPVSCGIGKFGRNIIKELSDDLPDFRILRGTESSALDCKNTELLTTLGDQYRKTGIDQIRKSSAYVNLKVAERERILSNVHDFETDSERVFTDISSAIPGITLNFHGASPATGSIIKKFEALDTNYRSIRTDISTFFEGDVELDNNLNLTNARSMGSFIATFSSLVQRVSDTGYSSLLTVFVYFLFPIGLDLLIIGVIRASLRRRTYLFTNPNSSRSGQVRYLVS